MDYVKVLYLDHTRNTFLKDAEAGYWKNKKWHDHQKAEIPDILNQLSEAAGKRARERREAEVKTRREQWNFPETVGKEDHRDRFRRFSSEWVRSSFFLMLTLCRGAHRYD